tara:strand:+ start:243 stop:503 length:261 start_codon:yes stop_codon:yes gene_type:complete
MEQPKQFDLFKKRNSEEGMPRGHSEYTLYAEGADPLEMSEMQRSDLKAFVEKSDLSKDEKNKIINELRRANMAADREDRNSMYRSN